MVWFFVDDGLAFHKKVAEAGNAAMGLWVRAGAWSTGSLTDGFIPSGIARSIGTQTQIDSLLKADLWRKVSGGYQFHDWDHRQLTKSEVEQKRKADRARKREQRRGRNVPPGQPPEVPPDYPPDSERIPNGVPPESVVDSSRALPQGCVPHPTPPSNGQFERGSHGELDPNEPPPRFCPEHMPDGTSAPCSACGATKQRRTDWLAEQSAKASEAARQRIRADAEVKLGAVANCQLCDDEGYHANRVCDHIDRTQTAADGIAKVRAALTKSDQP